LPLEGKDFNLESTGKKRVIRRRPDRNHPRLRRGVPGALHDLGFSLFEIIEGFSVSQVRGAPQVPQVPFRVAQPDVDEKKPILFGKRMEDVMGQKTGTAALLSIIAAIVSYFLIFSGHPFWGFAAAVLSIVFGFVGLIAAASPRVSGGIISIVGMVIGAIGIVIGILGMIGAIIF
jgi:hypothetical protein